MSERAVLPLRQKMLHRPRVNAIIKKGLGSRLLVFLAAPGYGKTQAMADYLACNEERYFWMKLGRLDNITQHFWQHFVADFESAYPEVGTQLQETDFPSTLYGFHSFITLIKRALGGVRLLWVFDDFGEIQNHEIKDFFNNMASANIDSLHLVLMTNNLRNAESVVYMTSDCTCILDKDLVFTDKETEDLYHKHGFQPSKAEIEHTKAITEGWALPLELMVSEYSKKDKQLFVEGKLTLKTIEFLFEGRFYSTLSPAVQKLFVKLGLLDHFTMDFAREIYDGNPDEIATLRQDLVFAGENNAGEISFHNLYRKFLNKKSFLLSKKEQNDLYCAVAYQAAEKGSFMEAIVNYRKGEGYENMLDVMYGFFSENSGMSRQSLTVEEADYFLSILDALPDEHKATYPIEKYLRATVLIHKLELTEAEKYLVELETSLPATDDRSRSLLADAYAQHGALYIMQQREDFGKYYKLAADIIPHETIVRRKSRMHMFNHNSFSMCDNTAGAKERMEKALHYAIPWASKVLVGGMSGLQHVYSAESAYLSHDMDGARKSAYRAVYEAESCAQHDLVCSAYIVLARVGLLEGDYAEVVKQLANLEAYAEKHPLGVVREIADTAEAWYRVKMRDYARVPQMIFGSNEHGEAVMSQGRTQQIYANYLIGIGEFANTIGMLENPNGLFRQGLWVDNIGRYILLAICYYRLLDYDNAVLSLKTAYDMTYENGLITLFAEAEEYMRSLIRLVRNQREHHFDADWLKLVDEKAADYTANVEAVRAQYLKHNPKKNRTDNPLTKREMEVLSAMSLGLTREEIAAEQYVSVNTIKTFIRSIFNKLGASNRSEAVAIAVSRGYISISEREKL